MDLSHTEDFLRFPVHSDTLTPHDLTRHAEKYHFYDYQQGNNTGDYVSTSMHFPLIHLESQNRCAKSQYQRQRPHDSMG